MIGTTMIGTARSMPRAAAGGRRLMTSKARSKRPYRGPDLDSDPNARSETKAETEADQGPDGRRAFTGYFDAVRDIMRLPPTTADASVAARRVTAAYCAAHCTSAPRNVSMLARDFIGDALYNPAYGYFSRQATIFSPAAGYDFGSFRDSAALLAAVGR
ncbi:hypothetical protein LPJ73_009215, partial [Coemansia sp. RSA 2703]